MHWILGRRSSVAWVSTSGARPEAAYPLAHRVEERAAYSASPGVSLTVALCGQHEPCAARRHSAALVCLDAEQGRRLERIRLRLRDASSFGFGEVPFSCPCLHLGRFGS